MLLSQSCQRKSSLKLSNIPTNYLAMHKWNYEVKSLMRHWERPLDIWCYVSCCVRAVSIVIPKVGLQDNGLKILTLNIVYLVSYHWFFHARRLYCIAYMRRTLLYGYDIREVIPPLCYACENGKVEVVEYLIKLRAHIKIQDKVNDES